MIPFTTEITMMLAGNLRIVTPRKFEFRHSFSVVYSLFLPWLLFKPVAVNNQSLNWGLHLLLLFFLKDLINNLPPPLPLAKSVFRIHDPKGLSYPTQLSVGLSKLNFHKLKHNFRDTISPMCQTSKALRIQTTFCCSALLLTFNGKIFLLALFNCYKHLCKSPIFQLMLWQDDRIIKTFLMTWTVYLYILLLTFYVSFIGLRVVIVFCSPVVLYGN